VPGVCVLSEYIINQRSVQHFSSRQAITFWIYFIKELCSVCHLARRLLSEWSKNCAAFVISPGDYFLNDQRIVQCFSSRQVITFGIYFIKEYCSIFSFRQAITYFLNISRSVQHYLSRQVITFWIYFIKELCSVCHLARWLLFWIYFIKELCSVCHLARQLLS
jgi:hypothetical protein